MRFLEKLEQASQANGSLLCVGLDPDPERTPADIAGFLCSIVEATRDLVCAYKPNVAFYEQLGETGLAALRRVLEAIPDEIPVIGDAKRGDVPNSARAYARALFDELGFDAATANPYLGRDSLEPFLERENRGVFIVCRTSNPGAGDLQDLPVRGDHGEKPLYQAVAELAREWNTHGNVGLLVGLVVGATYPEETRVLREMCPDMPFLVPGVGAQAGDLEAALDAGLDARGAGVIVNASRSVLYASDGPDRIDAARRAAESLRDAIERRRAAPRARA